MSPFSSALGRARERIRNAVGGYFLGNSPAGITRQSPRRAARSTEGLSRWVEDFPAWLNPSEPWIQSLRALYELPQTFPGSISPQAGLLLHSLVLNLAPRTVVETGTYLSVSTHWIAAALRSLGDDARLWCFDTFDSLEWTHPGSLAALHTPSQLAFVESALARAGLRDLVTLTAGDSSAGIASCTTLRERGVQLAFLDGDHTPAGVTRDFRSVEPLLDLGGCIVLHDTNPASGHDGPRYVLDNLAAVASGRYEKVELCTMPLDFGLAVLRRVG